MTRHGKTFALVTSAAVAVLVLSATALAAFAGHTTSAATSSGAQWRVSLGSPTWSGSLHALYPGAANDTEYLPFAVTNNARDSQTLSSVTVSIRAEPNGDAETATGADIPGCLASWFAVAIDSRGGAPRAELEPGRAYTSKLAVTMPDSRTNQDACQNATPAVTATAG